MSFPVEMKNNNTILAHIGNTPLIKIRNITKDLPKAVSIYAKLESFNPGGSIKDRAALRMINEAIKSGELTKDKIIMDPTSGNTGVAYAMIGAALGHRVELVMPGNVSLQRKQMAMAYGAKIRFSSKFDGSDGAIRMAHELKEKEPEKYFMPDQYNNPLNSLAHYETTGGEIWQQTKGAVTHFVATIGTGGTAMGTTRRLKEYNPKITCVGGQPKEALHGLEGLKHIPSSIVPGIYDESVLDELVWLDTEEAYAMMSRLAKEEGILAGHSSGAAMAASLNLAKKLDKGVVVTIFPDHGSRYFECE